MIPRIIDDHEAPLLSDPSYWQARRHRILSKVEEVLGEFPPPVPVNYHVIREDRLEGNVIRQKIRYASNDGDTGSAYLLFPAGAEVEAAKYPAVAALHQTVAEGKDEVVGISGNSRLKYGLELALRGYVVLAPDVLSAGERIFAGKKPYQTITFENRCPGWSMMGKMIYDHKQGIDFLATLRFVDIDKVGAVGHSLGGHNAFILAAFDERVKAAVSSCGFSPFAGDPTPERWGIRKEWFTYIPAVGSFLQKGEIPFDFNEIAAVIAPRAFFNWSTQSDRIFPHWESIGKAMLTIKEVFDALGVPENFTSLIGAGPHEFPDPIREMAYQWLDKQLKS